MREPFGLHPHDRLPGAGVGALRLRRNGAGGQSNSRLNARLNAASESNSPPPQRLPLRCPRSTEASPHPVSAAIGPGECPARMSE
jgi:hypothetical protein